MKSAISATTMFNKFNYYFYVVTKKSEAMACKNMVMGYILP